MSLILSLGRSVEDQNLFFFLHFHSGAQKVCSLIFFSLTSMRDPPSGMFYHCTCCQCQLQRDSSCFLFLFLCPLLCEIQIRFVIIIIIFFSLTFCLIILFVITRFIRVSNRHLPFLVLSL